MLLILVAPLLVVTAIQYLGTVLCLVRRIRWRIPAEAWLLAALVVAAVLLPGPFGLPRYRLPITPLLCVAAGAGLTSAKRSGGGRGRRSSTRDRGRRLEIPLLDGPGFARSRGALGVGRTGSVAGPALAGARSRRWPA